MPKKYVVQLTTTAIVVQTAVVSADSEEEAISKTIAESHNNVWEYQGADYDDINAEIMKEN